MHLLWIMKFCFFVSDVGYSFFSEIGFVSTVLNGYFHSHFQKAANVSQQLRQEQYVESFIYTTHPWLVYLYVNCPPNLVLQGVKVKVTAVICTYFLTINFGYSVNCNCNSTEAILLFDGSFQSAI